MALQKTYNFKGLEIINSYNLVESVQYSKLGNAVRFKVAVYANKETRSSGSFEYITVETYKFYPSGSFSIVGNDISTACYNYLKTLDNWSGSVDS